MAEAEGLLIDAARRATEGAARLWRRNDAGRRGLDGAWLEDRAAHLARLAGTLFGHDLSVRAAEAPARPNLLRRLMLRLPRHLLTPQALPGVGGAAIFLPPHLSPWGGIDAGRLYRLLALQQAARARRLLDAAVRPPGGLEGELFLLAEAAAADTVLLRECPGLGADLRALRAACLAARPHPHRLTPPEAHVERHYRRLATALGEGPAAVCGSLAAAAALAREVAQEPGRYRGLPHDLWWGRLYPEPSAGRAVTAQGESVTTPPRVGRMARRPEVREADPEEEDGEPGPWMIQSDDPLEHAEDPMGMQRPADRDEADPDELGDSLSELAEAQLVSTPEAAKEVLLSDDAPDPAARLAAGAESVPAGIAYPEWDYRIGAYRRPGATVRPQPLAPGDPAWAAAVLGRRRAQAQRIRRQFERLRPRRVTANRQPDGDEVDLDAFVAAHADLRAGGPMDERLYRTTRRARREVALALLVDVSGSTDAWVAEDLRIVDVEKEALLMVCQALDALGDPYTVQAFSGHGPGRVALYAVKGFAERDTVAVGRRIAALEPDRYTRAGAAIRHATAALTRRRESQRLLLLLSDGKPNDADLYEGRYGIEDMRQAVAEARVQGVNSFCLTVDRQAPAYLPRIFGQGRYTVLRHPTQLPMVLTDVLRQLLR